MTFCDPKRYHILVSAYGGNENFWGFLELYLGKTKKTSNLVLKSGKN